MLVAALSDLLPNVNCMSPITIPTDRAGLADEVNSLESGQAWILVIFDADRDCHLQHLRESPLEMISVHPHEHIMLACIGVQGHGICQLEVMK